jgi:hypothetical protein
MLKHLGSLTQARMVMPQAAAPYNRFHNLSNEGLADAIGNAELALKAHEAEVKALKEEFKAPRHPHGRRRVLHGQSLRPSLGRLDTAAVKAFLGDARRKFATASVTTVIRIKATQRLAAAA